MSRFASLLFFCNLLVSAVFPQSHVPVADGVVHTRIRNSGPVSVEMLVMNIADPTLRVVAFRPGGLLPTSHQFFGYKSDAESVLAAVNGDFFSFQTTWPVGNHVQDGVVVHGVSSRRTHIAIDRSNRPFLDVLSFEGILEGSDQALALKGVNLQGSVRSNVLYTTDYGSVIAVSGRRVISLRVVSGKWTACDTLVVIVTHSDTLFAGRIRPGEGIVVSGESAPDWEAGDTLSAVLCFRGVHRPPIQVLGGAGRILRNGVLSDEHNRTAEGLNERFMTERHPRTFVGFNRDTTVLVFGVADGRQESSIGMTFGEMAEFLLAFGISDAVNLDGGGSTTMVLHGAVTNSPSDPTGERGVANSLLILKKVNQSFK